MTSEEATQILRRMYDDGSHTRQAWASIVPFCVRYAEDLSNLSFPDILEQAEISGNYASCKSLGASLLGTLP